MDPTERGWPSDYGDFKFIKDAIEEQAAQLETLRTLWAAIKQNRQILSERRRYVAKMEMTIQFPDQKPTAACCRLEVHELRPYRTSGPT